MFSKYLLIICLLFAFTVNAQQGEVPAKVKSSFAQAYPKVKNAKWNVIAETEVYGAEYHALFNAGGQKTTVVLDDEGQILETKAEIKSSKLPASVKTFITSNFPGFQIFQAFKITGKSGGKFFEARIKLSEAEVDLYFNNEGAQVDKSEVDS
ncbi:MAG: hypothetical protein K9I71_12735 [Ignavibacteriales bacterium]|nr:hypothetical protein [Ignavibacteriales bacterium]MCF8438542.1 hypothetical protein [Ignavibacteriales bacterium]